MNKLLEIIFGPFRYKKVQMIDPGMGQYVFEQFQTFPEMDPFNGRGYHVMGQLKLLQPALVVTHPAGMPFDVTKIQMGEIDLFSAGGEGGLEVDEVTLG